LSKDSQNLQIRPADAGDAAQVTSLYLAARKQLLPYAPLAHDDAAVAWWVSHILIPQGGVWLLQEADTISGFYALSEDEEGGWLEQLYLLPDRIGQGRGSRLLQDALDRAVYPLRLYTFEQNLPARHFYEKRGFSVRQRRDGSHNEEGVPDLLYQLDRKPG